MEKKKKRFISLNWECVCVRAFQSFFLYFFMEKRRRFISLNWECVCVCARAHFSLFFMEKKEKRKDLLA